MKKLDPQLILSIGVLLASFAALFVSMRQAQIMNQQTDVLLEQTRYNVWPRLQLDMNRSVVNDAAEAYNLRITNVGTGPAIVNAVTVAFGDEPAADWTGFFTSTGVPPDVQRAHSNSILSNRVLQSSDELTFLDLAQSQPLMQWVYDRADEITVGVCFEALFGEQYYVERVGFKTNFEPVSSEVVESCPIAQADRFRE